MLQRLLDGARAVDVAGRAIPFDRLTSDRAQSARTCTGAESSSSEWPWSLMTARPFKEQECCHAAYVLLRDGVCHAMTYMLPIRSGDNVADELLAYLAALVDSKRSRRSSLWTARTSPSLRTSRRAARSGSACSRGNPELGSLERQGGGRADRDSARPAAVLVIADDDVRYDEACLMQSWRPRPREIVRPQNYFQPLPWHACLDTARMLINRVTGGDWPGTFGLRRDALERHRRLSTATCCSRISSWSEPSRPSVESRARPLDLFVRRLPPKTSHFWSQRVRQAYDEFARPARLVIWLALVPACVLPGLPYRWLGRRRRRGAPHRRRGSGAAGRAWSGRVSRASRRWPRLLGARTRGLRVGGGNRCASCWAACPTGTDPVPGSNAVAESSSGATASRFASPSQA